MENAEKEIYHAVWLLLDDVYCYASEKMQTIADTLVDYSEEPDAFNFQTAAEEYRVLRKLRDEAGRLQNRIAVDAEKGA